MSSRLARFSYGLLLSLCLLIAQIAVPPLVAQDEVVLEEPQISARAAILIEYPSGRILYQKAMHDRLAPASTTKILTAILAIENGNLEEEVTAAASDLVGEASMGLVEGENQSLRHLLYGLMLPSGNDAAMAIARALGSKTTSADLMLQDPVTRFASMMNARVAQLGLEDSQFANPHGLDTVGHYSSAYDLASLTWYALHLPAFSEVAATVSQEIPGHALLNINELLTRYEGADGIKTGYTGDGGLCLVGSATRGGQKLVSVVLNAPRWYVDTAALLDYGYARLAAEPHSDGGEQLSVSKRGAASWLLVNAADAPRLSAPIDAPQGGGLSAPSDTLNAPDGVEVSPARPQPPDFSPTSVQPSSGNSAETFLALAAFFSLGFVLLFTAFRKMVRVSPRFAAGRLFANTIADFATDDVAQPAPSVVPHGRRRSPNLLNATEGGRASRIERALQLAIEEREGSSMAEFLIALKDGPITVEELAGEHRLPPSAFLALARAQTALGYYADARSTLLHGVTVLPHNRILSLALHQLSGDRR